MISVSGFPFSGDQPKAKVSLRLAGLTGGQYYVLGDQLEGELTVIPQQDMQLRSIVFRLDYIMKGKQETATILAETGDLEAPKTLKGGQSYKIPISIPYRFPRPTYKGGYLVSYWRLNVFLDYDPAQYGQSLVDRMSKIFTGEKRHGTSFEIWVRYGKGAYVVAPQELPIDLLGLSSLPRLAYLAPFIFAFWFLGLGIGEAIPEGWHVMLLLALVVFIGWLVVSLSTFQMTPMEIKPLRDGQLRLRILDRGNDHLKNAIVGYRLLERFVNKGDKNEFMDRSSRFQKAFHFAKLSHREEYFYEAVLPWPEIDLPTTGKSEGIGYEWEFFLQLPNPLTGGMHEKSWPIEVGWERFRLAPPTAEELEQEELEVLKLKELEYLPRN